MGWGEGGRGFKGICQLPFLQPNALCGSYRVLSCSYRLMKDDGKLIDDIHSIPHAAFILSWNLWDPLQKVELLVNLSNHNKAVYQWQYHEKIPFVDAQLVSTCYFWRDQDFLQNRAPLLIIVFRKDDFLEPCSHDVFCLILSVLVLGSSLRFLQWLPRK